MSLSARLRLGWLLLLADVAYWIWQMGHGGESGLPTWHTVFNIVTVVGGCILLVALLAISRGPMFRNDP